MHRIDAMVPAAVAVVWMGDDGRPTRIMWAGRRYRVTDDPTPLEDAVGLATTHPPALTGWRFQGTPEDGAIARIFDVVARDGRWQVLKTYA